LVGWERSADVESDESWSFFAVGGCNIKMVISSAFEITLEWLGAFLKCEVSDDGTWSTLELCRAVPPRPCLGSIAVHDVRCTTATPFIKDCLTETILIPHMNHASNVSLDKKRIIT
jgi:hypothetical protein